MEVLLANPNNLLPLDCIREHYEVHRDFSKPKLSTFVVINGVECLVTNYGYRKGKVYFEYAKPWCAR